MTPRECARVFRRAARRLPREIAKAEQESARDAVRVAQNWSMGPYSLAQLARMGHPYARRDPHPPQDSGIINYQTGLFIRSWEVLPTQRTSTGLQTTAVNTAPYSGFLDVGTRLMIRRPLVAQVLTEAAPARIARLARAIRNSFE